MVDILYNLFLGNKDLFKGLYIYEEYSFETFPVIRLNLNNTATYSLEAFLDSLKRDVVFPVAKAYGVEASFPFDAISPSSWLNYLISSISEKFGKQVVILIDEYDYPLLDSINNSIFEDIRVRLESFYSVLKARISDIKFCFITGITRFSQVSIFSKLNNLIDMTDRAEYAAICGYTDDELDLYFSSYFEKYYSDNSIFDRRLQTAFREKVKEYYDGYRFSMDSDVSVYNPVSIGSFFNNDCVFNNFWIETGAQKIVRDIIRRYPQLFKEKKEFLISENSINSFEASTLFSDTCDEDSIYSYLLQAGYLSYRRKEGAYFVLSYPNYEVSDAMNASILTSVMDFF